MGLPDSVRFNTLYGTLYDPSSPLADEHGFKKNYIDAMRELKVTNMRWPGNAEITNNTGSFTGKAQTTLIKGDDKLTDQFTYDQYSNYQPAAKGVDVRSNAFTCAFPLHSFTQIKVSVKK